ncbi:hypothetical protein G9A89_009584 [Geosiphon pyriformis]|nr:hypothetical protein G9A89_009584 [Geosiphon pyriformis]
MKALHHQLPVAVHKQLYNKCYPSIICLYCGNIKVSDHMFSCLSDVSAHARLLLSMCVSDVVISMALCKSFVFNDWYRESISVFKDPKVAALTIMDFVSLMEGNGSILCNGSLPLLVIDPPKLLSDGVVKLLGVTNAFGVSFGFHKYCRFFSGISDMVSVHIDV